MGCNCSKHTHHTKEEIITEVITPPDGKGVSEKKYKILVNAGSGPLRGTVTDVGENWLCSTTKTKATVYHMPRSDGCVFLRMTDDDNKYLSVHEDKDGTFSRPTFKPITPSPHWHQCFAIEGGSGEEIAFSLSFETRYRPQEQEKVYFTVCGDSEPGKRGEIEVTASADCEKRVFYKLAI